MLFVKNDTGVAEIWCLRRMILEAAEILVFEKNVETIVHREKYLLGYCVLQVLQEHSSKPSLLNIEPSVHMC